MDQTACGITRFEDRSRTPDFCLLSRNPVTDRLTKTLQRTARSRTLWFALNALTPVRAAAELVRCLVADAQFASRMGSGTPGGSKLLVSRRAQANLRTAPRRRASVA